VFVDFIAEWFKQHPSLAPQHKRAAAPVNGTHDAR
jgi:hypothetical protein